MAIDNMQHREFSLAERQYMELRLLGKWSLRRMAEGMCRDHSSLSREIQRNKCPDGRYRAREAQERAEARMKKRARGRKLDRDPVLAAWVEQELRNRRSPETVAGRLKAKSPPHLAGKTVSAETVYQWLYNGNGRYGGLTDCLWTRRKRRYARKGRKPKLSMIQGRIPIGERIEDGLPGHMESDSMIWHQSAGLLSVQTDRKVMVSRLRWCSRRTAEETAHSLRRAAETLPHGFVKDMTFDNGGEGARHGILKEEYGISTFFCAPGSPWQKPYVENVNRIIRHRIPRKTKTQDLAALDWRRIEEWLNNLPRKRLGYLTPNEALAQYLSDGATRT